MFAHTFVQRDQRRSPVSKLVARASVGTLSVITLLVVTLLVVMVSGLVAVRSATAQQYSDGELGNPFVTCHSIKEYGGHFQSWAFSQGNDGLMYVGNTLGVLQFDGSTWRLIETTDATVVRSLDTAVDGTVYVGSSGDIGFLAPDQSGLLTYKSLLPFVDEGAREFNDVRTTFATPNGIYFQSWESLFRFTVGADGSWTVTRWEPTGRFLYAFWVNGTYYVHDEGVGLLKLANDKFELLPGSERFADERVQVMLPFGDDGVQFVVGSFNQGLFLFDGQRFTRFATEADDILTRVGTLYAGSVLADGSFGLSILDVGFAVVNRDGRLLQIVTAADGTIPSNTIISTFVDKAGTVWLAPETGICRVETPSPLTRFDESKGLTGAIFDITRFQDVLYVSTGDGLFFLDKRTSTFQALDGLEAGIKQSFGMVHVEGRLLVAVSTGIYEVRGDQAILVVPNVGFSFAAQGLHQSRQNPRRVFAALADGLGSILLDSRGRWQVEGHIDGIHEQLKSIIEPTPGELWLSTVAQGVLRVVIPDDLDLDFLVERFEDKPEMSGAVAAFDIADRGVFATKDGVFRFDASTSSFVVYPELQDAVEFTGTSHGYSVVPDQDRNLWVNFGGQTAILRLQSNGTYLADLKVAARFAASPAEAVYPESGGTVWFGTNDGELIRYDPNVEKVYNQGFDALVRRVVAGEDSTVFGGAYQSDQLEVTIPHSENALRFDFASTSFEDPAQTRFQSKLDGQDRDWSAWTTDVRRYYTNLAPKDYVFRVRALNLYGKESNEATYSFAILAPWYRTWWAYLCYLAAFLGVAWVANGVQDKRLVKRERAKAELREAQLRASAAEATANAAASEAKAHRAENERMRNVELLSEIGRNVTATLSIEGIIDRVYASVNSLMDASVFGIGIYNEKHQSIDFPGTKEKGVVQPPYRCKLDDANRIASYCFNKRTDVIIQDYDNEHKKYVPTQEPLVGETPESVLYMPLLSQDKPIGVITAQSFEKNAYGEYEVNILRNLATYAAIALDNAAAYRSLNASLDELRAMQEQLVVQEKLASLGQLTAGIAHEIKNPLNFVNNFAQLISELVVELGEELEANKDKKVADVSGDLEEILSLLKMNADKINEHGQRADGIVTSMLQHSRADSGERTPTDLNELLEEYVSLAYHGVRATNAGFSAEIVRDYDDSAGILSVIPQDIGRVLLNLLNNAFYAVQELTAEQQAGYVPTVSVSTRRGEESVTLKVSDNGSGIPEHIRDKIFEPFFTTKPTGSGTGLGLSMSYDIVTKAHGGTLEVAETPGGGATFVVTLPDQSDS